MGMYGGVLSITLRTSRHWPPVASRRPPAILQFKRRDSLTKINSGSGSVQTPVTGSQATLRMSLSNSGVVEEGIFLGAEGVCTRLVSHQSREVQVMRMTMIVIDIDKTSETVPNRKDRLVISDYATLLIKVGRALAKPGQSRTEGPME